ncbi:hypothetical protein AB6A40_003857 [Gnathostoma spinigerum]|uniref:Uncharacterized protein n=1 Tax=Gnathostoma spinigerum TaxID=75299 RepID=A0ABD6EAX6_9BILA
MNNFFSTDNIDALHDEGHGNNEDEDEFYDAVDDQVSSTSFESFEAAIDKSKGDSDIGSTSPRDRDDKLTMSNEGDITGVNEDKPRSGDVKDTERKKEDEKEIKRKERQLREDRMSNEERESMKEKAICLKEEVRFLVYLKS